MKGEPVAVRIRMQLLGRKHRPFYRIVAIDSRQPRNGRILEELGHLRSDGAHDRRAREALSGPHQALAGKGALASEKVSVLFKKYMAKWEKAATACSRKAETAPAS